MSRDKQKARTAAMLEALRRDAINALESYQVWASVAHASGRLTPVQFLAVVLWEAGSRIELSESDDLRVVSDWWRALETATAKRAAQLGGRGAFRHVYPLDVITLLEMDAIKVASPHGWCMSCDELDVWLASMGRPELCALFFQACGLRGKVIDLAASNDAEGSEQPDSLPINSMRVRVKGTDWTSAQEALLFQDFKDAVDASDAAKYAHVAGLWGIKDGSVKKQLSTIENRAKKSGSIGSMANKLTGTK